MIRTWFAYELGKSRRFISREGDDLWTFFRRVTEEIALNHISGVHVTDIVYESNRFICTERHLGGTFEYMSIDNPMVVCINWGEYLKTL